MLALILFLTFSSQNLAVLNIPVVDAQEVVWTQQMVKDLAVTEAKKHGLNQAHFLKVLDCENSFNAKGQSQVPDPTGPNSREDSWGAAQIHLTAHSDITKDMAEDPSFAIPWMAEEWDLGNASLWSCWSNLYSPK